MSPWKLCQALIYSKTKYRITLGSYSNEAKDCYRLRMFTLKTRKCILPCFEEIEIKFNLVTTVKASNSWQSLQMRIFSTTGSRNIWNEKIIHGCCRIWIVFRQISFSLKQLSKCSKNEELTFSTFTRKSNDLRLVYECALRSEYFDTEKCLLNNFAAKWKTTSEKFSTYFRRMESFRLFYNLLSFTEACTRKLVLLLLLLFLLHFSDYLFRSKKKNEILLNWISWTVWHN